MVQITLQTIQYKHLPSYKPLSNMEKKIIMICVTSEGNCESANKRTSNYSEGEEEHPGHVISLTTMSGSFPEMKGSILVSIVTWMFAGDNCMVTSLPAR